MKTKAEILAALAAAGVQADESMTVEALKELAGEKGVSLEKQKPAAPKLVTVTAACQLVEEGNRYAPGDSFEVTEERAASLGDHVKLKV